MRDIHSSTADGSAPPTVRLPLIVDGKRIMNDDVQQLVPDGQRCLIMLPALSDDIARALMRIDRQLLVDVPLQTITSFLNRAGRNWRSEDYARRRLFIRQLQTVMGYSEQAARAEADWIGALLCSHARMHDLVEVELGNRFVLDEWVRSDEAHVRAFPRGLVTHLLPGNVPSSTVVSAVRALLTKNVSVLKPAINDPVTSVSFALSLLEIDPDHPVARAVNVVYWPRDDELGVDIVRSSDAVVAWGTRDALEWAHREAGSEASFVPLGPKWSIALVGRDAAPRRTARGVAHDVCLYEQQACFSTQHVFVEGDADAFLEELEASLAHYETLLPPSALGPDDHAALASGRAEVVFEGGTERCEVGRAAIIVVGTDPLSLAPDHPLGRTVFVHQVDDLTEAYAFVDSTVQTVAGAPWDVLRAHRDELARRGASRLVDVGMSNFFRIGGSHDGMRVLQHLVRFVSHEDDADAQPKGMLIPVDQTDFLEHHRFGELVF